MKKTLLIVESPNKIHTLQNYLGDEFQLAATYGHIADLATSGPNNLGINLDKNFEPHYVLMDDKVKVLDNLLKLAQKSKQILVFTDQDREGEAIAFLVHRYLKDLQIPIKRGSFNEITKEGVKKGLANLREIDSNLVAAAQNRRILDRLAGFLSSNFLSNKYQQVLSSGRTQSVACKIVTEREQEIDAFKPEQYFVINASFSRQTRETFTAKLEHKPKTQKASDELVAQIYGEKRFQVAQVKAQKKLEHPERPLITASLQQICAKKYGFPADKTSECAQALFEKGLCTYIRTDSPRIDPDFLELTHQYLKDQNYPVAKKPIQYAAKGSNSQGAHECIRPTSLEEEPTLYGDNKLVYKTIREHYLASQLKPAVFNTLQIKITGEENKKLVFRMAGKALEDPGYLVAFGPVDPSKIEIPSLQEDEILKLKDKSVKSEELFTKPPPRYNDATILKKLEESGVGRPSTYSSIVKTISHRNYVEKKGNTFYPTELGKKVNSILDQYFSFMDIDFTAKLEDKLDLIANGELNSVEVLREFYQTFKQELDRAYQENGYELCKCGGVLLKRKNKYGEFWGCSKFCGNVKRIEQVESRV